VCASRAWPAIIGRPDKRSTPFRGKSYVSNNSKVSKPCLLLIGQWLKLAHVSTLKYNLNIFTFLFLLAVEAATMHVKITPNNQITLPDEIVSQLEVGEYFDVEVDNNTIVLTPVVVQSAEAVRDKLLASGISEKDVADASAWARSSKE
jgi:bifunctional DNA-binding transcriptional regulator/antitoxin component of YhaV-PrlF toxin-antitoxin module